MMKPMICLLIMIAVIWLGCTTEQTSAKQKIINPNGDSELALLMREMFDDGMITKQQLLEGLDPQITVDYMAMFTAHATEPDKVARPEYAQFGKAYEQAVEGFLTADAAQRAGAYQTMVATCMNCHQVMCPGPMVKIKKMYLSEGEFAALQYEQ